MSYVIKAVLSNPHHPEYGQVTIPFPIPYEEYDHMLELVNALEIGNAVKRDCRIDEIDSYYSVMRQIESSTVNLDELDYLAKRLDSFTAGCEDVQFQAMARMMNLTDIKDFINLTFCCRQVTVITDFSDLETIGRNHFMTLNGGCASTGELENLDGEETAHLLISSGSGVITPYGVVFDNGMKLESIYDGCHFPCYHYDASPITAGIVSCRAAGDKEPADWLYLPASQGQIRRTAARAGILELKDISLCAFENLLSETIESRLPLERESVEDLNDMCKAIARLSQKDLKKLDAVVTMLNPCYASQIKQLAENIDQFEFIPDVHTLEELGRYMIQSSEHFDYDENLERFYDYEKYGRHYAEERQGGFTESGYISYHGTMSLDELMAEDPAEAYQREQKPQMGGA